MSAVTGLNLIVKLRDFSIHTDYWLRLLSTLVFVGSYLHACVKESLLWMLLKLSDERWVNTGKMDLFLALHCSEVQSTVECCVLRSRWRKLSHVMWNWLQTVAMTLTTHCRQHHPPVLLLLLLIMTSPLQVKPRMSNVLSYFYFQNIIRTFADCWHGSVCTDVDMLNV